MDELEVIKLKELLEKKNQKSALREASKKLAQQQAILNCESVNNVTRSQFKNLFRHIPRQWRHRDELDRFIDIDSCPSSLLANIIHHIDGPHSPDIKELLMWIIAITISTVLLGLLSERVHRFATGNRVEKDKYTIGILDQPKKYKSLEDHLEKNLIIDDFWKYLQGKKVQIVVDGDRQLRYGHAKSRITDREWDIAFSLSPMLSSYSKSQGYSFVARMFPHSPYYQSALFVKADSPMRSLNDIRPSTVIALGETRSASSFFMPIYELYGKTFTVNMNNRGQEIVQMVKRGEVDMGAAAYGDTVKKEDKEIRVLHLSRDIPGSGVYLSPSLSERDRRTLSKVLLTAPSEVKNKDNANYGHGAEADYSKFLTIVNKVEGLVNCVDLKRNPVRFFCDQDNPSVKINGKINGVKLLPSDRLLLTLESPDKQIHQITIDPAWLDKIPGIEGDMLKLEDREVKINNVVAANDGEKPIDVARAEDFKVR